MDNINTFLDQVISMAIDYTPKIALALVVFFVGIKIINKLASLAVAGMKTAGVSENLLPFISSLVGVSLKVLLIFSVASILGIEIASFVAVLAAAGFAVGLALQGSLGNFAAGIIILIFKPYKVSDWIELDSRFGKVQEIQIFNTIIITPGRKTLIIPNGQIIQKIVTNYSKQGCIRLELRVAMPYNENYPKVRDILLKELKQVPKILDDPKPEVGIETYDSHSIILVVRPYVIPDDYWEVTFQSYERIKGAFHHHNIQVAYPESIEMGEIGL